MFSKNKRKTDSKIRFQNPRFKTRLEAQRHYQRPKRSFPKTGGEIFLSKIGLGSWLSRVLTIAAFFLLIYIVFIPNLFFIKYITVTDSDQAGLSGVQNLVNSFLGKQLPWPEKNLLLLSKSKLKNYLTTNDQQVLSVGGISKKFPNSLTVAVNPRVDRFALETASSTYYTLSNDGLVTAPLFPNASGTLPSNLILITLTGSQDINIGQTALTGDEINFINNLQTSLPQITQLPIDHYELADFETPDVDVYSKNGYQVKFNFTIDINETLTRLKLLLSQLTANDVKNLYYVDMRFQDRGYVCYINTACAQATVIPNIPATSTPDSLTN